MKLLVTQENAESLYSRFAEPVYQEFAQRKVFSINTNCRRCGSRDEYQIPHFISDDDIKVFRDVMNTIYSAAEEMGIQDHVISTILSKITTAKAINKAKDRD